MIYLFCLFVIDKVLVGLLVFIIYFPICDFSFRAINNYFIKLISKYLHIYGSKSRGFSIFPTDPSKERTNKSLEISDFIEASELKPPKSITYWLNYTAEWAILGSNSFLTFFPDEVPETFIWGFISSQFLSIVSYIHISFRGFLVQVS